MHKKKALYSERLLPSESTKKNTDATSISVTLTLPLVGFFVIIILEKKKIRRMKLLTKILLGLMAYNYAKSDFRNIDTPHVGRRSAGRINPPINDGGL